MKAKKIQDKAKNKIYSHKKKKNILTGILFNVYVKEMCLCISQNGLGSNLTTIVALLEL